MKMKIVMKNKRDILEKNTKGIQNVAEGSRSEGIVLSKREDD